MKNKIYAGITGMFVIACLIAIPMVKADKIEATPEDVVLVTAGTVLGQGLLAEWDWSKTSEMKFGAFPGGNIYNEVRFLDELTIDQSVDGFVAWDDFTIATGTAAAVYTNATNKTGKMMCDGASGMVFLTANGTFAPSLTFSLGTSTAATYQTSGANLIASTTLATSTTAYDRVVAFKTVSRFPFELSSGESIVGQLFDGTTGVASTTYLSNWTNMEFSVHCWVTGK